MTKKIKTKKPAWNSAFFKNPWDVPFLPEGYEKNLEKWKQKGATSKYRDPFFERILKTSQPKLKKSVTKFLIERGYNPIVEDGYVYAEGQIPILLVAHLDTVHKEVPRNLVYHNQYLISPEGIGGDDRCGVYMILEITRKLKCHVLFTEDEEIGAVGARKFTTSKTSAELKGQLAYIIEMDRRGKTDAVFYECGNTDFINYIVDSTYFKEEYGSFTDICYIAPALDASAVNFSCGYFNEHSKQEYIDLEQMCKNIGEIKSLIKHREHDRFEWKTIRNYYKSWSGYDDYYDIYGGQDIRYFEIFWHGEAYDVYEAVSDFEALGMFLTDYPDLSSKDVEVRELFV